MNAKRPPVIWGAILLGLLVTPVLFPSVTAAQSSERYSSKIISLLEQGETVFCSSVSADPAMVAVARNPNADCVFIDMEHAPYDVSALRTFMQAMTDAPATARRGYPGTDHPIIGRIPANGREMNEWQAKQVLDQGVHGVRFPHIETVEQAQNALSAMRFPHQPGDADYIAAANGVRGAAVGFASGIWGMPAAEYIQRADVYPLDPNGALVSVIYIENEFGVRNIRDILQQVKGITMVHPGEGDLGVYYGDPVKTEEAVQTVLAACLEFDVPCVMTSSNIEERIRQGFRVFYGAPEAIEIGRRAAGRSP